MVILQLFRDMTAPMYEALPHVAFTSEGAL
ncbi:unannotated protein [freshwater metagenome]|uniref:Unannotated protein n=1 Tax=freshwater metagenome TaxID=449393 RepID=A0A6J6MCX7_9ZZZZ